MIYMRDTIKNILEAAAAMLLVELIKAAEILSHNKQK